MKQSHPFDTDPETSMLAPGQGITSFPRRLSEMSSEMRQLEKQTFDIAFESALGEIASGSTLSTFCNEYHVVLQAGRFRAWIYANPARKRAYEVAQALWADATADDLLRIADGIGPDGNPSALLADPSSRGQMVGIRKWLMAARNREKYGEVRKVETTTHSTVDVRTLTTDQIKQRVMEMLNEVDASDGTTDALGFLEGEMIDMPDE